LPVCRLITNNLWAFSVKTKLRHGTKILSFCLKLPKNQILLLNKKNLLLHNTCTFIQNYLFSYSLTLDSNHQLQHHKILPNKTSSTIKRTPDVNNIPNSSQKTKTATPKIKSGIRKFTPGSARKSQKKTPQKAMIQNRDKVRCELFTQNQSKDEVIPPPRHEPTPTPVPETPLNRKPMPASYAATPSYPQVPMEGTGGSSEVYKVSEVLN
jgi:hypothetical protein